MAEPNNTTAEMKLQDGTEWQLKGWRGVDGLGRWFDQAYAFWKPMITSETTRDPHNIRANVTNIFDEVRAQLISGRDANAPIDQYSPVVVEAFNRPWGPFHPDSRAGHTVARINEEMGPDAALFAFAFLKGRLNASNTTDPSDFQAMVSAVYPGLLDLVAGQKRLADERNNFRATIRRLSVELDEKEDARRARFDTLLDDGGTGMVRWARRRGTAWREAVARWRSQKDAAIASLDATKQAYTELMALKAPVDYWTTKATTHGIAEKAASGRVILFFSLATPAMAGMFTFTGWYLLQVDKAPAPGAYVVASAGLATTAGLLFWVGRLLTKLYLSQHHLRQDAEERAVMTTTYLALTANQAASDADRTIILNALFRATSDGIIKEDGAMDASVAGLISKFASRP